eukprot:SAG31_NODE_3437_length_4274_cov_2.610778_1_plen_1124_part_00
MRLPVAAALLVLVALASPPCCVVLANRSLAASLQGEDGKMLKSSSSKKTDELSGQDAFETDNDHSEYGSMAVHNASVLLDYVDVHNDDVDMPPDDESVPAKPWPDTSTRIHTIIVGDGQMTPAYIRSPASHAADVDLVWGAALPDGERGEAWRAANPSAVLTRYLSYAYDPGNFQSGGPTGNLSWWKEHHSDWIVYQRDKKTPAWKCFPTAGDAGCDGAVPLDITNPEVVAFQVEAGVMPSKKAGYDGIAWDNFATDNDYGWAGHYDKSGAWVQQYIGCLRHEHPDGTGYCINGTKDPKYTAAVLSWGQQMAAASHKIGMLFIPNYGSGDIADGGWRAPTYTQVCSFADGILDEGGYTIIGDVGGETHVRMGAKWENILGAQLHLQQQGKGYYFINEWGLFNVSWWGNVPHTQWPHMLPINGRAYALSSYLLGKNNASALSVQCTQCYEFGGENYTWWSEDAADIGPATSHLPTQKEGVWWRWYANAVAVVNPTEQVQSVQLPSNVTKYFNTLFDSQQHVTLAGHVLTLQPANGTTLLLKSDDSRAEPAPAPPIPAGCKTELLPNGICLPAEWPPRFDPETPPKTLFFNAPPTTPPPQVVNITLGRQLLVDDFLIEEMRGLERTQHKPVWEKDAVLSPDLPWETIDLNDARHQKENRTGGGWPQSTQLGSAQPYSGGVHWHQDKFIAHYQTNDGDVCYAESRDGRWWKKPLVGAAPLGVAKTNIVVSAQYSGGMDGNVVIQDHRAPASERFKMATMPFKNNNHSRMHYEILASPDGITWTSIVAKTGPAEDRSTLFYNPFRDVWVFSIKSSWRYPPIGRARSYFETKDLRKSAWTCLPGDDSPSDSKTCNGTAGAVPWVGADKDDLPNVYNLTVTRPPNPESPAAANCTLSEGWNMCSAPSQLYNLDVVAYESVLIGFFAIFRGFYDGGSFQRTSGELNEIYLGVSRDGFTFFRPLPRQPFLESSWPLHSWRNNDVQSVGGGILVVDNDTMHVYASGHLGLPQDLEGTGGNASMGLATMRRDRFLSLDAVLSGQPGELLTRPLVFDSSQVHLFVNVILPRGSFLQVAVLDRTGVVVPGFQLQDSTVETVPVGEVASEDIDSTRLQVHWTTAPNLQAVSGKPVV